MTVKIWGKYQNKKPEVIDETDTLREAETLAGEYRMAFGGGWTIWVGAEVPDLATPRYRA